MVLDSNDIYAAVGMLDELQEFSDNSMISPYGLSLEQVRGERFGTRLIQVFSLSPKQARLVGVSRRR